MSENSGLSGPRRRVGAVTTNACTECRKKRSKCDGQNPCLRCTAHGAQCIYEQPQRKSKDEMRSEIEELRQYKAQAEPVIAAIAADDAEEVLRRLRTQPLHEVSQWLESGRSNLSIGSRGFSTTFHSDKAREAIQGAIKKVGSVGANVGQGSGSEVGNGDEGLAQRSAALRLQVLNNSDPNSYQSSASGASPLMGGNLIYGWNRSPSTGSIQTAREAGQQALLGIGYTDKSQDMSIETIPPTWTNICPENMHLVEHLMTLYFCWEYPTFASLSKDHFLVDFKDHNPRYCSSLLVNAMLALGCRFSDVPESRADPNDRTTSGDHFFAEAKRLLSIEEDVGSLSSIQALGLMAIREGGCGRDTESFYYSGLAIRLSVENGLHYEGYIVDQAEKEVRRATFWGAFTLDQAWSLNLSKMPHLSYNSSFPPKPSIIASSEKAPWAPYSDQGHPSDTGATQPCNVHSVYECFCDLSSLVHGSLYTLYSPQKRFTSQDLIYHYNTYMAWYDQMPDVLRLGKNFTPSVLFVHIYYHYSVLTLFLPFINLRLRDSEFVPSAIIASSAAAITKTIDFYDSSYTLRLMPSMTPYLIFISTIATLKCQELGCDRAQLERSIRALQDMAKCHGFAERALEIVKFLAGKWGVQGALSGGGGEEEEERRKDWEHVKPRANSTNLFVPRGSVYEGSEGPLFSVFPLQGMPLVDSEDLERDGFVRVDGEWNWNGNGSGNHSI